jgi:hypothetical protein
MRTKQLHLAACDADKIHESLRYRFLSDVGNRTAPDGFGIHYCIRAANAAAERDCLYACFYAQHVLQRISRVA